MPWTFLWSCVFLQHGKVEVNALVFLFTFVTCSAVKRRNREKQVISMPVCCFCFRLLFFFFLSCFLPFLVTFFLFVACWFPASMLTTIFFFLLPLFLRYVLFFFFGAFSLFFSCEYISTFVHYFLVRRFFIDRLLIPITACDTQVLTFLLLFLFLRISCEKEHTSCCRATIK